MIYETIKNFNKQFSYEPQIENKKNLNSRISKFIIAGMGGSNLVADILKIRDPYLNIIVHKNYGLPHLPKKEFKNSLLIASSYSGNTEETIDSLNQALALKIKVAVVTSGGKLLNIAKKNKLAYIQMPKQNIQPRLALGFNIKSIAKLIGRKDFLSELKQLEYLLKPEKFKRKGKLLAKKIKNFIPIIYASQKNIGLAYNWKIKFNETGKIPAFYNAFPELNHNEMIGFNYQNSLVKKFYFLFLKDQQDEPKIKKRMVILEKIFSKHHLPVETILLEKGPPFYKIFSSLILADWTSYYTALQYKLNPEEVKMIEEFKKLIS